MTSRKNRQKVTLNPLLNIIEFSIYVLIKHLIKHFLFPLLLPRFTLLVHNYLEKFQIPAISECNK
jgi:hypothetical protein